MIWDMARLAADNAFCNDPCHLAWQVSEIPSLEPRTNKFSKTPAGSPGR